MDPTGDLVLALPTPAQATPNALSTPSPRPLLHVTPRVMAPSLPTQSRVIATHRNMSLDGGLVLSEAPSIRLASDIGTPLERSARPFAEDSEQLALVAAGCSVNWDIVAGRGVPPRPSANSKPVRRLRGRHGAVE